MMAIIIQITAPHAQKRCCFTVNPPRQTILFHRSLPSAPPGSYRLCASVLPRLPEQTLNLRRYEAWCSADVLRVFHNKKILPQVRSALNPLFACFGCHAAIKVSIN